MEHDGIISHLQISKLSVDESSKDVIPSCQLAIDWQGPHGLDVPVFKRRINLKGATDPKNYFTLHIRPSLPPLPTASTASATSAAGQWYSKTHTNAHTVPYGYRLGDDFIGAILMPI